MSDSQSPVKAAMLGRIARASRGAVWTPRDFLDLGGRDAVDKVLQRLTANDDLRRIDRGLYDKPDFNRLTGQLAAPDPASIIDAIARRDQIRVLVDGMTAANDLGFTNAVPARIVVHTDARLKTIKLGNLAIAFRQAAASKLFWAGRPAMRIVQALHWLRDTMAGDDRQNWMGRLTRILDDPAHGAKLRADLADGMFTLPIWMQQLLRPLVMPRGLAA
jgi:hypothetical protein